MSRSTRWIVIGVAALLAWAVSLYYGEEGLRGWWDTSSPATEHVEIKAANLEQYMAKNYRSTDWYDPSTVTIEVSKGNRVDVYTDLPSNTNDNLFAKPICFAVANYRMENRRRVVSRVEVYAGDRSRFFHCP